MLYGILILRQSGNANCRNLKHYRYYSETFRTKALQRQWAVVVCWYVILRFLAFIAKVCLEPVMYQQCYYVFKKAAVKSTPLGPVLIPIILLICVNDQPAILRGYVLRFPEGSKLNTAITSFSDLERKLQNEWNWVLTVDLP